jgi:hypothetical protein
MSEEEEATFHAPSFCEVLSRLAHEIRESRKLSAEQFKWFKDHASDEFTEKQKKTFSELRGSIESAITRAKDEILDHVQQPTVHVWAIEFGPDEPIPKE